MVCFEIVKIILAVIQNYLRGLSCGYDYTWRGFLHEYNGRNVKFIITLTYRRVRE
jgi:hypothetical protein